MQRGQGGQVGGGGQSKTAVKAKTQAEIKQGGGQGGGQQKTQVKAKPQADIKQGGGGQLKSQTGTKAGTVMDSKQGPGQGPQSKQLKSGAAGNKAAAAHKVETQHQVGMRALCAAAALLASGALPAATIGGRLGYPSEALPAMIVVARNAAGETRQVETKPGQERYRLQLPAGSYVVFAIPVGIAATPGQVPLRGAHTAYSACARDKARLQSGQCQTGPLEEIRVAETDQRENVDIDDWYLPDGLMATLNLAVREVPRAQGARFEAYPADTSPLPSTRECLKLRHKRAISSRSVYRVSGSA